MSDKKVEYGLKRLKLDAEILQLKATLLVAGRHVRILSDYNGQPHGRSKRSLRGEIKVVERVHVDLLQGFFLFLRDERVSIPASEVEWL